jgi:hypothetical protein
MVDRLEPNTVDDWTLTSSFIDGTAKPQGIAVVSGIPPLTIAQRYFQSDSGRMS